jgi:hypothetical protein
MENNGLKRSLKVTVNKTVNGVPEVGYPKSYNGMTASSTWTGWTGTVYTSLTDNQLAQLSDAVYNARLTDFKAWVTSQESGINFNTQVLPTAPAILEDLTVCPLPASYYMVEVSVNNAALGSAVGGGPKLQNSQCTIQAFPVSGAQFDGWKVNGEPTPSIGAQIHIFTVTDNISFEAVFSVIVVTTFQISYTNHVCQKV